MFVKRVHQLLVSASETDTCLANFAADVWLDHVIHLGTVISEIGLSMCLMVAFYASCGALTK